MRKTVKRGFLAGAIPIAVAAVAFGAEAGASKKESGRPTNPGPGAGAGKVNLVFVLDGLRPDSINATETPNLHRLKQGGVSFADSHAAVPTVTRVNSPVIGTGNHPGTNGIVGNSMVVPAVSPTTPFSTGEADQLLKLDAATGGQMVTSTTLGERLQENGKSLFALGSGSSGSTLLLNPRAPRGVGSMLNVGDVSATRPFAFPSTLGDEVTARFGAPPASNATGSAKVDYAERVLREYVLSDVKPDVILNWFTEPDGTQHRHGAGSPEGREGIRNDDRNIGLILDRLQQLGVLDKTNIIVTSDHGFSLFDANVNVRQELINAGLKASATSEDVVVANTGSVALHVKDRDPAKIREIAAWLQRQPWTDSLYTKGAGHGPDARGSVPGTFSLELINQAHATRHPDIVLTLPWTSKTNAFGVVGTATNAGGGPTGPLSGPESGHGSFSPHDIRNTLITWGVDFKDGVVADAPAGTADITPTLLSLLGISGGAPTDGRVLREAIEGGPNRVPFRKRTFKTKQGKDYAAEVTISEVDGGRYRYVDSSQRVR